MPKRSSKEPDENQRAASIVAQATGGAYHPMERRERPAKNPAAVELGRLGGLKGGKARAAKLSQQKRSTVAKKAAVARWGKKNR
jgi:hypothetical protein